MRCVGSNICLDFTRIYSVVHAVITCFCAYFAFAFSVLTKTEEIYNAPCVDRQATANDREGLKFALCGTIRRHVVGLPDISYFTGAHTATMKPPGRRKSPVFDLNHIPMTTMQPMRNYSVLYSVKTSYFGSRHSLASRLCSQPTACYNGCQQLYESIRYNM